MDLYTLSNSGAYGEHGPTTVGLSGHKSIPLYTGSLEAHRFGYDVVYTNHQAAGAYRGYGATQGIFAVESIVSELAEQLGMDATEIRDKNMIREGMVMPAYYNEIANACALDRCMEHCRKMFNWRSVPRSVTWATESTNCRCCHGNAGQLYFQCGCRLSHSKTQ